MSIPEVQLSWRNVCAFFSKNGLRFLSSFAMKIESKQAEEQKKKIIDNI